MHPKAPSINNPELFQSCAELMVPQSNDNIPAILTSCRPKRTGEWQCQDKAAISILKAPVGPNDLQNAFEKAHLATCEEEGGCSVTTLLIEPHSITVAWLGDSPAFLAGVNPEGKIMEIVGLNEPHIPLYEKAAIEGRGGIVTSEGRLDLACAAPDQVNNYSLSMARSLGNRWLQGLLNRIPSVTSIPTTELTEKLRWYAILGSDGILPESERNLMFPGNPAVTFTDNDIIQRSAELFRDMVNEHALPWLTESGNWASNITQIAQERLLQMEQAANKEEVGYPAVDDTTLLIIPLPLTQAGTALLATVADGHRNGGEMTAAKAVTTIHHSMVNMASMRETV